MNDSNLRSRIFDPALKKARIPKIRFHDLRHCYASLLIEQGESPKYIQNQMGHSSINVTFDIYGHLMKDSNQEAATRLRDTIFGSISWWEIVSHGSQVAIESIWPGARSYTSGLREAGSIGAFTDGEVSPAKALLSTMMMLTESW